MTFSEFFAEHIKTFNELEHQIDICKTESDIEHVKRLHDSLYAQCIGFAAAVKHYEDVENSKTFLYFVSEWSLSVHQLIDSKLSEITCF